jgi:predicted nucleotidyltransferase
MSYEIYIFGSAVRGDVAKNSDVDVLVITNQVEDKSNFPEAWSIYSKKSIEKLFSQGKLFAWHLHLDAKCIYSTKPKNFLEEIGEPAEYKDLIGDFSALSELLDDSLSEMKTTNSEVFEIGLIYTALRDIAMVASTALCDRPCFSRYSPYEIPLKISLPKDLYESMIEARLTSTRGLEFTRDASFIIDELVSYNIKRWVQEVKKKL